MHFTHIFRACTQRTFMVWIAHMVPSELRLCFDRFLFISFFLPIFHIHVEMHYEIYLLPRGGRWHSFTWHFHIVLSAYLICSSITTLGLSISFSFRLNNALVIIIIEQEMVWSNFMWRIWKLITQYTMIGDCNVLNIFLFYFFMFAFVACVCVCFFSYLL